uniref:Carboxylic ester hydrolase n=1 Tax=Diabrotica virgifera virgifera TaxID=50390 RepID=A0A6P7G416_DIAVI
MLKLAFFLSVHFIFKVYCDDDLIVTLPNGQIRGITVTPPVTIDLTYYAFLGVPFAAPPIGELRFKPPQPANNWDGILEANNSKISCYQTDKDDDYQTEDCLHLNVYTPNNPSSGKKTPVLVFIYGGTFVHGHANYDPKSVAFLMRENITVVTFNYRVGPFGFLSTADTVVPGNMGLKDQQFVLKWMQNNIHLFGGDKAKVTIMGQSAGAASVTYQVLSPGSAGLLGVFAPVIEVPHDGAIISDNMYESLVNGTFNKVPLLLGFNSEESIGMAKALRRYVQIVANFVKNLEPSISDETIDWPLVQSGSISYLDIDEQLSIKENPREFSYAKWEDIFSYYARTPYLSY